MYGPALAYPAPVSPAPSGCATTASVLRTSHFEVGFDHLEACEVGELTGWAWLTVDELGAVDGGVFPGPVAVLAARLVGGDIPVAPVELAWVNWRGDDKRYPLPAVEALGQ